MTPADLGNVQILNQFWTADRQRQFFELLVTKYLPLSEVEISQMQEDPEEFIIVEESVSLFESLRVVTEGTIMLFGERMGSVTQLVLQQLLQQALGNFFFFSVHGKEVHPTFLCRDLARQPHSDDSFQGGSVQRPYPVLVLPARLYRHGYPPSDTPDPRGRPPQPAEFACPAEAACLRN